MTTPLATKEIAKLVRKELKAKYPTVKFSVTSEYDLLRINYFDGVPTSEIEAIARQYGYIRFVFVDRSFSHRYALEVLNYVKSRYNHDDNKVELQGSDELGWSFTHHDLNRNFNNIARDCSSLESIQAQMDRKDAEKEAQLNIWMSEKELETKKEVKEVVITPIEIVTIKSEEVEIIKSVFPKQNKNDTIEEYAEQLEIEQFDKVRASVTKVVKLTESDYDLFTNNLLTGFDWLDDGGGTNSTANLPEVEHICQYSEADQEYWKSEAYRLCILVYASDRDAILVDPQGYNYARYVGFMDQQVAEKYLPKKIKSTTKLSLSFTKHSDLDSEIHTANIEVIQVQEVEAIAQPIQSENTQPMQSEITEATDQEYEPTIENKIVQVLEHRRSIFEAKKDRKLSSYKRLVSKNNQEADNRFRAYRRTADTIPFGQPVLIGHHSEKRHRRDIRRMQTNIDKGFEAQNKAKYYEAKIYTQNSQYAISAADPDVLSKLERKLAGMERNQEYMKSANKIVKSKKLSQSEKIEQLQAMGHTSKEAADLIGGDFCGRFGYAGYAGYQLSNNNANMKTIRDRIASIKAQLVKAIESPEVAYPELGLKVFRNAEVNRLQLIFNCKPDQEVRSLLKSNGFKWAPSQGAWQRDLNNNGTHAANRVIGKLNCSPRTKAGKIIG